MWKRVAHKKSWRSSICPKRTLGKIPNGNPPTKATKGSRLKSLISMAEAVRTMGKPPSLFFLSSDRKGTIKILQWLSELLSLRKVMEHYPFYYIPLTLPSPPTTGERIKVRGSNVIAMFVPLFTWKSIIWTESENPFYHSTTVFAAFRPDGSDFSIWHSQQR